MGALRNRDGADEFAVVTAAASAGVVVAAAATKAFP